jgi:protein NirF
VVADLQPGPAVLHMEFTARGDQLWLSLRDGDQVQVWDPYSLKQLTTLPAEKPSGIFFSSRAQKMGY